MAARLRRLDRRFGQARLALAGLGVVAGWLVFGQHMAPLWTLLFPIAGFILLVVVHERLRQKRKRAKRAADFYQRGIERLEGRWRGRGYCGDRLLKEDHPYAADLDLFGRGSLFEMLCTGRTLAGRKTLAHWLLHPASPQEIRARQAAVDELRDRLDLREDLAVMGEDVRRGIHAGALPKWGEAKPILDASAARALAAILCLVVIATFVAMMLSLAPPSIFLAALLAAGVFGYIYRMRVLGVIAAMEQPTHDIGILAEVLARLEAEPFTSSRLVELQAKLQTNGQPPSKRIALLNRLVELLDSRDHLLMRVAGPPLLWSTQLAFAIEAWRKLTGPKLRRWLDGRGRVRSAEFFGEFFL